jgi:hypothetical protein
MISKPTYDILTLVANWLAAIGTNAAVIVALVLAYRQNRPRVNVTARMMHVVDMGERVRSAPLYFNVTAVNTGARDVVVQGIQWHIGWFRKSYLVQLPDNNGLSARLPTKLLPGEVANYLFSEEVFTRNAWRVAELWQGDYFRRLRRKRVRVGVYLSTGENILVAPDERVMKRLIAAPPRPATESVGAAG